MLHSPFLPSLRRPLLALAVLAALLVAGGTHLKPASAATPASYQVAVTFTRLSFTQLNDGCDILANCYHDAELYGYFTAEAASSPWNITSQGSRFLGVYGAQSPWCPSDGVNFWDGSYQNATCFKNVGAGISYYPAQTFLCTSTDQMHCAGPYAKNNNTIVLTVKPGDSIGAGTGLKDYDKWSADDPVCGTSWGTGPLTAAQLATLNTSLTLSQGFNGYGGCHVYVTMKRIG